MKSLYRILAVVFVGLSVLFSQSCGHSTVELVSPVVPKSDIGQQQKVIIMPFADYTTFGTPYEYWWRNVMVMESLQDELKKYSYHPVMEEDVIAYLLEKGIIQEREITTAESPEVESLREEIAGGWSDTMKQELAEALYHNLSLQKSQDEKYWNEQRLISLDRNTLRDIGSHFGAKYIIRGRIIEVSAGRDDSFNPVQTGILPFFFKMGSRMVFGIAESDTYEMIDKMALGSLIGGVSSTAADMPIDDDDGLSDLNAVIWGSVGAGAAHLAHKSGRVDKVIVHLRLVIQDTYTGDIVWANRAEVKTTPKSVYGERDINVLMERAIQDATATLMQNFVLSQVEGKYVTYDRYGTLSVLPRSAGFK